MKKVLVITGPTAIGKSAIALKLAQKLHGHIINADSQQVYHELNIGTAKPSEQDRQGIVHHGFDLVSYQEPYSVKDYQTMARQTMAKCHKDNILPILVGGTGLYLKACLFDYHFDESYQTLPDDLSQTNEALHDQLRLVDPASAKKIHPNNRKRVIRALSIAESGISKTQREAQQTQTMLYDVLMIILDQPRASLHQVIEERVKMMFKQGLKHEVETFFLEPHTWMYQSFQAIGYKEWKPYLEGHISEEQVMSDIITATRQYAKRQITWFKHQFEGEWFSKDETLETRIEQRIKDWLQKETL